MPWRRMAARFSPAVTFETLNAGSLDMVDPWWKPFIELPNINPFLEALVPNSFKGFVKNEIAAAYGIVEDPGPEGIVWLDLPAEIRMLIYSFVFASARIVIEPANTITTNVSIYREPGTGMGLLRTSMTVYREALVQLQKSTDTIQVVQTRPKFLKRAVVRIPDVWLNKVKYIEYNTTFPKLHLAYEYFSKLQKIYIATKTYHVHEKDKPLTDDAVCAMVLRKVKSGGKSMDGLGYAWIRLVPHIKVVLTALLFNRLVNKNTAGWVAEVETVDFKVIKLQKAEFNLRPCPPGHAVSPKWRISEEGWDVKVLQ